MCGGRAWPTLGRMRRCGCTLFLRLQVVCGTVFLRCMIVYVVYVLLACCFNCFVTDANPMLFYVRVVLVCFAVPFVLYKYGMCVPVCSSCC